MPPTNLLFGRLGAGLEALLNLHAAQNLAEFWATARRVSASAIFYSSCWLDPSPSLPPFRETLVYGKPFPDETDFRRFCDAHPVKLFVLCNPDNPVMRLSDVITETELRRTRFYSEFMAPSEDAYAVVLAIGSGNHRSFIGFHRREEEGDFSSLEMQVLRELQLQLSAALERVNLVESERQKTQALALLFSQLPLATVLLDWRLELLYYNRAAIEMASIWEAGDEDARFIKSLARFSLPADIAENCRAIKACWEAPPRNGRSGRAQHALTLQHEAIAMRTSIRLMHHIASERSKPVFGITFESLPTSTPPNGRSDPAHLAKMARLSPREREVALLACDGSSDKEIATRLGKSILTVKKQLGAIYRKLDVHGRTRLAALLRP